MMGTQSWKTIIQKQVNKLLVVSRMSKVDCRNKAIKAITKRFCKLSDFFKKVL